MVANVKKELLQKMEMERNQVGEALRQMPMAISSEELNDKFQALRMELSELQLHTVENLK